MTTKILTVLGARPQFIKASTVSAALRQAGGLHEVVVHTGQHFDAGMSDIFFSELGMDAPAHHLAIHGGGHGEMTGRMLIELERVLQQERPDAVLVYGDTNSTLAGALAAAKLHIPVAHVEAGLRSHNMAMPEEINRCLVDRVSHWLFTPTAAARTQLLREGVADARIVEVGDVMYDLALQWRERAGDAAALTRRWQLDAGAYVLATLHRAGNTDSPEQLASLVDGLARVARTRPVIVPLHPRTRAALQTADLLPEEPGLRLVEPVGYGDMTLLTRHAAVVATDSGGLQKEAFFHRVPCVTLREETEWTELVEAGWNRLAPPGDAAAIAAAIEAAAGSRGADVAPYGHGDAARRIVARLAADLA